MGNTGPDKSFLFFFLILWTMSIYAYLIQLVSDAISSCFIKVFKIAKLLCHLPLTTSMLLYIHLLGPQLPEVLVAPEYLCWTSSSMPSYSVKCGTPFSQVFLASRGSLVAVQGPIGIPTLLYLNPF